MTRLIHSINSTGVPFRVQCLQKDPFVWPENCSPDLVQLKVYLYFLFIWCASFSVEMVRLA